MGAGVPFRAGVFDGAISISALQWLFTAERKEEVPYRRLLCFFETLYSSLRRFVSLSFSSSSLAL